MGSLSIGQVLKTINGKKVKVESFIGEGGQGFVYRVSYNGRPKALKWYKSEELKDSLLWFNANLKNNIKHGSPSSSFLWPEDLTEWNNGSFGYIMPLSPEDYRPFKDYLNAEIDFDGFVSMIDASINIVTGFRSLHRAGFTYQDLNDGNFFIRPSDGAVLICDNDNVAEDGENSGIVGKAKYMAPLIVMGKKMPDKITDRFSLAVVLFLLFMRNHPLEGKAVQKKVILTEGYQKQFFGEYPVFIADPTDDSNRPVKGENHNRNFEIRWPLMSEGVRELFIKAFSKGAMAEERGFSAPIELVWCRTLLQYRSDLVVCPKCNKQIVFDHSKPVCMKCGSQINVPFYLNVGHYSIPVVPGGRLCMEHVLDFENESYNPTVIGEVIVAKNDCMAYGLRNFSDTVWQYQKDSTYVQVKKNGVVYLKKGRTIKIEGHTIEIC